MSKKIFYSFYLDKEKMGVSRRFEPSELLENIRIKLKFEKNIKFINNNICVKEEDEKKLNINNISEKTKENIYIVYLKSNSYHIFKNYKYYNDYSGSKDDLLFEIRKTNEIKDECYFLFNNDQINLEDEKEA